MPDEDNAEYSLLSSTRYDDALLDVAWNTRVNGGIPSRFMLLPYHFDRLVAAVEEHGWVASRQRMVWVDLAAACDDAVEAARPQCGDGPFKIRILLSPAGVFAVTATPVNSSCGFDLPSELNTTDTSRIVYIDPQPTTPSIFTRTKTTHRLPYNAARARVDLSPMPSPSNAHVDILLHNSEGRIMETSIRNVAFLRSNRWVTPTTASGCLPGVMRRLMLEEYGFATQNMNTTDVVPGELVLTFNGVEGIQCAKIARYLWRP